MSSSKVRADHEALQQIAKSFASRSESTTKATQNIKAKLGVLQGGDWVGKGATKFYNEMTSTVLPSLNRLSAALAQAAMVTGKISLLMREAEREAAGMFRESDANDHAGHSHNKAGEGTLGKYGLGVGADFGGYFGQIAEAIGVEDGEKKGRLIGNTLANMFDPDPRSQAVMTHLMAGDPQAAITETIRQYNVDVSGLNGAPIEIRYAPDIEKDGETFENGSMDIGRTAFNSPGWLASTIGHEALHVRQKAEGRWYTGEVGTALNEVECYDYELAHAADNGLSKSEIATIEWRRLKSLQKLPFDIRMGTADKVYTLPSGVDQGI